MSTAEETLHQERPRGGRAERRFLQGRVPMSEESGYKVLAYARRLDCTGAYVPGQPETLEPTVVATMPGDLIHVWVRVAREAGTNQEGWRYELALVLEAQWDASLLGIKGLVEQALLGAWMPGWRVLGTRPARLCTWPKFMPRRVGLTPLQELLPAVPRATLTAFPPRRKRPAKASAP